MNDAQYSAARKVEAAKHQLDLLHGELAKAERRLNNARKALRRQIHLDPDSWNTITELPAPTLWEQGLGLDKEAT